MMQKISLLVTVLLLYGCTVPKSKTVTISPTDERIQLTGRIQTAKDSITVYWPGTSIRAKFLGKSLQAWLKDERGENYFNIIIDGDSLRHIRVDTAKRLYTLASDLGDGPHTIELSKRSEWDKGKTWFYGLEVVDGDLEKLPEKNGRVIEFFGNSITAGHGIEDDSGKDRGDSIYTNNYFSYASVTARHFQADCYLTVKSGIGIMVSWFPLIMPEMYDRLDPTDSLSKWDFAKVTPDIVVINLFQNDSWIVHKPEHPSFKQRFGSKAPDAIFIVHAYKSFVQTVRNTYPDAQIICALGSMDGTKEGSPWPGYIEKAVAELHDAKIHTLFFPFINKNIHPLREDNKVMADRLIDFIEKNISW